MYQLNETETWREHRRELLREAEDERLAARQNGTGRSDARLRVVRVPGGFALVEDGSATEKS
jgi:hypothetical protein